MDMSYFLMKILFLGVLIGKCRSKNVTVIRKGLLYSVYDVFITRNECFELSIKCQMIFK